LLARNVARRFRLDGRKGRLAEGLDADFCLVELGDPHKIIATELWTRHPISPYIGRTTRARVTHTYVRGRAIWSDGNVSPGSPKGQFLKPEI
jgi:allantoinase